VLSEQRNHFPKSTVYRVKSLQKSEKIRQNREKRKDQLKQPKPFSVAKVEPPGKDPHESLHWQFSAKPRRYCKSKAI